MSTGSVERLARLDVPAQLPRRRRRSLSAGADVLVDLSEDMIPFRTDLRMLMDSLRVVVGEDGLRVLRFSGRPFTQIGVGRRATWQAYELPPIARVS